MLTMREVAEKTLEHVDNDEKMRKRYAELHGSMMQQPAAIEWMQRLASEWLREHPSDKPEPFDTHTCPLCEGNGEVR